MEKKTNSDLFFTCSLIEQMGRDLRQPRGEIVRQLGTNRIRALLQNASILHCEPLEKVSDDASRAYGLTEGEFDNVAAGRYSIPSAWDMGKVYARLIEDVGSSDQTDDIHTVYTSWMDPLLSNYNSSLYYQPREYLAECWRRNTIIDD